MNNKLLTKKGDTARLIFQFLVLFVITFVVHFFVLRFVFPGYYRPLSIQHEDHYTPAAFAYAVKPPYSFGLLLNWPRPIFMMFLKLIGYTGTHGSIACAIALVFVNCILSALFIKRVLALSFDRSFIFYYILYCYFLFASPYFYILYTQDIGSHLSYFFLILGAILFYHTANKSLPVSTLLLLPCCLLAFLSKETYQLAALFVAFLWFLYYRKTSFKLSIIPLSVTLFSFIIATLNNRRLNSVFVNLNTQKGAPYEISLSPRSVLHEWLRYAHSGVTIAGLLLILLVGYLVWKLGKTPARKQILFIMAVCVLVPGISWLPNAVLPNHHYNGYSFNGLYVLYLLLFFLPVFQEKRMVTNLMHALVVILCLVSYVGSLPKYRNAENRWVLDQEINQQNLLHELDSLISRLTPEKRPQKILVEGLTFPFQPFTYPESLREYPNAPYAYFDVVHYTPDFKFDGRKDLVKFILPADTALTRYDQKWVFGKDGRLIGYNGKGTREKNAADSNGVGIDLENLSDFKTDGIYPPEDQGIAWTNGNVRIDLNTSIRGKDSVTVVLSAVLGEKCKNIVPRLSLRDTADVEYTPYKTDRKNDAFYYYFAVGRRTQVKQVRITSPTIDSGPDRRILSFPLKEIVIK